MKPKTEIHEKLLPYIGTTLYDDMESFLLSYIHEDYSDMPLRMLKWKRDEITEDLKCLDSRYRKGL